MGDFNINPHNRKTLNITQNEDEIPIDINNTNPNIPQHYYHKHILHTLKEKFYKDLVDRYIYQFVVRIDGSYDQNIPLRQPWKDIYQPMNHIPSAEINKLIVPITMEELKNNIKDLPNNKATGPNNISNEIIKKLLQQMLEVLLLIFNRCLEHGIIPSQFELAYLYPIPKPQWWNYDINLTRPIILLNCIRKLMVKIINDSSYHSLIDHQHDTKNSFYLALQDLSKAYDRVDLNLLQLALKRINIPEILITFIEKLFSNHRNQILFPFGCGSEYTTTNGIIQGELSLPCYGLPTQLANIKINKDKTKILTNDKDINKKQHIPLKFGEDLVDITVVPPSDNERILGIYINTNNKFQFTINKINRMLKYTCSNLRRKRITHDHVIYYVINIPRIEYLCQHFILLPYICNNFNRTIRSIYKSSLLLPRSIYNTIIHNQIYPNILNIWDRQFASLLNAQANSPLTRDIIEYLILYSQSRLWTNDIFFTTKFLDSPSKKLNRIENLLCIMHNYKLEFKFSFKFNTKGGVYPFSAYLIRSNKFFSYIKSLKTKELFYLQQIITVDGLFLKSWKEIQNSLSNKKGRPPAWYKYLRECIVLNQNNLQLNFDLPVNNYHNSTITKPKVIAQNSKITRIKNIWIAYWCPRTNNVIYGRVIEKNHFYNHHQTITFEHFIHIPDSHPSNNNLTPRSCPTYLSKCTGCRLSEQNVYNNNNLNTCYITSLSNSTFIINISKSNHTFPNYQKPIYKCSKQHSTIRQIALIDFNFSPFRKPGYFK
ncbi:ribonuclease H-like domain-containing protein [Rhizophagus irregularis DAOM 181602=DAOM 197198]|nr:ribonuclease H-like domain-containing protein [Rhizophagus irregularis DAOM 181602=DAOM 197198]